MACAPESSRTSAASPPPPPPEHRRCRARGSPWGLPSAVPPAVRAPPARDGGRCYAFPEPVFVGPLPTGGLWCPFAGFPFWWCSFSGLRFGNGPPFSALQLDHVGGGVDRGSRIVGPTPPPPQSLAWPPPEMTTFDAEGRGYTTNSKKRVWLVSLRGTCVAHHNTACALDNGLGSQKDLPPPLPPAGPRTGPFACGGGGGGRRRCRRSSAAVRAPAADGAWPKGPFGGGGGGWHRIPWAAPPTPLGLLRGHGVAFGVRAPRTPSHGPGGVCGPGPTAAARTGPGPDGPQRAPNGAAEGAGQTAFGAFTAAPEHLGKCTGGGASAQIDAPPVHFPKFSGPRSAPCVTFRRVVASLRGPGRSPGLPFACCVGSLLSVGRCGRCSCWCRFHVHGAQ